MRGVADDLCMDLTKPNKPDAAPGSSARSDLQRITMGSVALLVPLTKAAYRWLVRECQIEPWQMIIVGGCEGVAVEHRFADEIIAAWESAR